MLSYNFRVMDNKEFGKVRVVDQEGKVWFAADDVAMALGYFKLKDAVLTHVVSMNKRVFIKQENSQTAKWDIPKNGLMLINEYGLRQLVRECNVNSADRLRIGCLKKCCLGRCKL